MILSSLPYFLYLLTTQGPNSTLNNTRKATQPFRGPAGPSGIMRPALGASSATAIGREPSQSKNPGSLRRRDLLSGHSEPKAYAGFDAALQAPGMTKITMPNDMKNKVMCAFPSFFPFVLTIGGKTLFPPSFAHSPVDPVGPPAWAAD